MLMLCVMIIILIILICDISQVVACLFIVLNYPLCVYAAYVRYVRMNICMRLQYVCAYVRVSEGTCVRVFIKTVYKKHAVTCSCSL